MKGPFFMVKTEVTVKNLRGFDNLQSKLQLAQKTQRSCK